MTQRTVTPEQRQNNAPFGSGGWGTPFGSGSQQPTRGGGQQGEQPFGVAGQEARDFSEEARFRRLEQFLQGGNAGAGYSGFDAGLDLRNSAGVGSATMNAQMTANRSVTAMLGEAFRLRNLEDERFGAASERLTRSVDQLPETFSDADFEEFFKDEFTLAADASGQAMFGDLGMVRGALGAAGITGGGVAAGLAQAADMKRLRDTKARGLQAKMDLRQAKMNADAQDALRNINAEFQLANFNNQSPSLLGLDALTNASELALTELGLYLGDDAARRQAKAEEDAAKMGMVGNIIGGGIPLIPGI